MKTKLRFFSLFSLALILAVSAVGMMPVTPARADAYVVNSLNDVDDTVCDGTHCSLREAIDDALSGVANDTITFSVAGTIHLGSTLPVITNNGSLIIDGGNNITISGDTDSDNDGDVRILSIFPFAVITVQNLTLDRGLMTTEGGGAIYTNGTLTLNNVTISNSVTTAGLQGGGAMFVSSGTVNINDSVITGNSSTMWGGGIHSTGGILNITNSTFSGNSSTTESGGAIHTSGALTITGSVFSANLAPNASGGAIAHSSASDTATITGSTFFDNQAKFGGAIYVSQSVATIAESTFESNDSTNDAGAIYLAGTGSGTLTVQNSTFSANTSAQRGGGIFSFNPVTLTNVTISGNSGSGGAGGVHTLDTLTVKNTIIANNVTGGDCILDIGGSLNGTSSNNLIEDASNACGMTNGTSGNVVGSDPLLGSLQNNGGTTETHGLLANSPAINKGTNSGCPATDQIGTTRPQGGTCDIGAVELPITSVTYKSLDIKDGHVLESGENTNVGGSILAAGTTFHLGDDVANKQYIAILHFDTSALPDTAIITSATLKIKKYATVGTDPFTILGNLTVDMRKPSFGADLLSINDFQILSGRSAVATFGTVPVSNWYSAALNSSGRNYLSKTTTTQFRLRFATDDNNNLIADYMRFYSGDHANSAVWPQLIVEYYVP